MERDERYINIWDSSKIKIIKFNNKVVKFKDVDSKIVNLLPIPKFFEKYFKEKSIGLMSYVFSVKNQKKS